jgi:WD40 repeat protein
LIRVLDGHSGHVNHIAFSADGQYILSAANDQSIILWDRQGELIKRFQQHHAQVNGAFFSPDGRHFVSVDSVGQAICWLTPEGILREVSL